MRISIYSYPLPLWLIAFFTLNFSIVGFSQNGNPPGPAIPRLNDTTMSYQQKKQAIMDHFNYLHQNNIPYETDDYLMYARWIVQWQ